LILIIFKNNSVLTLIGGVMRVIIAICIGIITTSWSFLASGGGLYQGTISDSHSHVKGGMKLGNIIKLMDKNNVDAILIMRRDNARINIGRNTPLTTNAELIEFRKLYPKRIRIGLGMQIEPWYSQDQTIIPKIRKQVASGNFKLIGETTLHGGHEKRPVPPSSPLFKEILRIASKHKLPVLIHHFHTGSDDAGQLLEAFRANSNLTIIWAHICGFSKPDRIRELFRKFPKLYCDLAWLPKKKRIAETGIVDMNSNFTPQWKNLIESYPNRFLVGVDLTTKYQYGGQYTNSITRIRKALGGLSPEAARKVATENFHRILSNK
jgi:predicted TIM-barrel fold metal-dependent hydrolase